MKNASDLKGSGTKNKTKANKKKKDAVKSVVDLPYELNWPSLDFGVYSDIVSSLSRSFNNYVDELKNQGGSEDSSELPTSKIKNATKKLLAGAEPLCIVFGYNSVMRGLEKNKIKCVFVKAEAMPSLLTKAFIPICQLKNIPLIPVKNLAQNFEKQISNKSTLAVGFTVSACEKNGPFCELYEKCCKALGYNNKESHAENEALAKENSIKQQIQNSKLATTDVNLFYLKRKDKTYRVFNPDKTYRVFNPDKTVNDNYFIKFEALKIDKEKRMLKPKPVVSSVNKHQNLSPASSKCSFVIDIGNDDKLEEEPEHNNYVPPVINKTKHSTSRYFNLPDSSLDKNISNKRKASNYLPTKIKKIKGNPNRRS